MPQHLFHATEPCRGVTEMAQEILSQNTYIVAIEVDIARGVNQVLLYKVISISNNLSPSHPPCYPRELE